MATAIKELIIDENLKDVEIQELALPDEFIRHGTVEELEEIYVQKGRFFLDKKVQMGHILLKSKRWIVSKLRV